MAFSRIGVIGVGVMGEALLIALIRIGIASESIRIVEKREERRADIALKYSVKSGSIKDCDVVFLLVKPQDLGSTLQEYHSEVPEDSLIVSFVAGKTISFIESQLSSNQRVLRVMPNTPMTIGKGFSAISKGKFADESDVQWLKLVLSSSSEVIVLPEGELDAITALGGSGPAYFFAMVEAMAEAGKRLGLNEKNSLMAAKQVLIGSAAMIEHSGLDPRVLRENVTSPNGTTAAALSTFQDAGFQEIVFKAMKAARDRSAELGK